MPDGSGRRRNDSPGLSQGFRLRNKHWASWESQFGLEHQAKELGPYSLGGGEILEMCFAYRRDAMKDGV